MYKLVANKQLLLVGTMEEVCKKLKYYSLKFDILEELISYLS
ncbi:MAG: hypothetical protein ACTHVE_02550 [Senegalia sp. (in: firmicutes)]